MFPNFCDTAKNIYIVAILIKVNTIEIKKTLPANHQMKFVSRYDLTEIQWIEINLVIYINHAGDSNSRKKTIFFWSPVRSHAFYLNKLFFLNPILTINPYPPPCQLSLWEETGEPGENPRLSAECWRTLPTCDQMFDTGFEPMTSVVGGRRLDGWATEASERNNLTNFVYITYLLQRLLQILIQTC